MKEQPARRGERAIMIVLFVAYLVLLTWIVLWKLEVPWIGEAALLPRPVKLIPFLPSAEDGASKPLEVVANLLLFVPFGIYLGLLAPSWQWWKATSVFVGATVILEITQHTLSIGSFDTTDLIVNTAGGLAGLGLLAVARGRFRARTTAVMIRICSIGAVLSVLAIGVFIASPLHYGPQRDVIVHQTDVGDTR